MRTRKPKETQVTPTPFLPCKYCGTWLPPTDSSIERWNRETTWEGKLKVGIFFRCECKPWELQVMTKTEREALRATQ